MNRKKGCVLWIAAFCVSLASSEKNLFQFSPGPVDTTVTYDKSVTLNCGASDNSGISFHWTLDGRKLENDTRRYMKGSDLHISRVSLLEDIGEFKCVATNTSSGRSYSSNSAELNILWITDTVRVVDSESSWDPAVGGELILRCKADSNPEADIRWLFNGEALLMNEKVTSRSNRLHIKDLNLSHNGIYSCEARNDVGALNSSENFVLKLTDGSAPHITVIPHDIVSPLKSDVFFDCSYENAKTTEWFFGISSDPLRNNSRYITYPNGTLKIASIENEDQGFYKCRATSVDSDESVPQTYASKLQIAYLNDLTLASLDPRPQNKQNVTVFAHQRYETTCLRPKGLPHPKSWWEDPRGNVINDSGRIYVNDMRLIFREVQDSDVGSYTCVAENSAGQTRIKFSLHVLEKLKFIPAPVSRKLELNSSAKIYCKAGGSTPPIVKWTKIEPMISEWPPHIKDDNGTLHFNRVMANDTGKYMCVATNSQGTINATIDVDVIVMPKFSVHPTDTVANEGEPVMLHCIAEGDPTPTIQWDKNNELDGFNQVRFKVMKNGSLFASEIHPDDGGKYGCTAGNSGGFRREEISLVVKVKEYNSTRIGRGGFGAEGENTMTKTIAITLGAAGVYIVLVIGLMMWCRYRRARRKAHMLAQATTEADNSEAVHDMELKDRTPVKNRKNVPTPIEDLLSDIKNSPMSKLEFARENMTTVMLLGHGEYGEVFLAKANGIVEPNTETVVMIKALQLKHETPTAEFRRDVFMYFKMKHENVCTLLGVCQEDEPLYMITDYTDWGDLKQYLLATKSEDASKPPKQTPLSLPQNLMICQQVAVGMEYIHKEQFVHQDLAARNCLISSSFKIKIGCPCLCSDTYFQEYLSYRGKMLPIRWASAEAVLGDVWSTKSDVWSFAVLVCEVFNKAELPFPSMSNDDIMQCLQSGELKLSIPDECPEGLVKLLESCWLPNSKDRPTFTDVVSAFVELSVAVQE